VITKCAPSLSLKATLTDARIALQQWQAAHSTGKSYSNGAFEDVLRSYMRSLQPSDEMDSLEAAWDWAIGGFVGQEVTL
jgi:hypothetical protein